MMRPRTFRWRGTRSFQPHADGATSAVTLLAMGRLRALVEEHRDAIDAVARRHHGRTIAVFGSVARGDERDDSDIDFLVEFEPGSSLFDLLHLQDELAELLGAPVDVVSAGGLRARDEHILREAIPLA